MKVLAISNVFGRPWEPIRGPYNQIIFDELAKRHEINVLVPVSFIDVFKNFLAYWFVNRTTRFKWPYARYFIYWYIPGVSQSINSLFMFFSIAIAFPRILFFKKWDVIFGSWLYPDCVVANWVGRLRGIPSISHAIGSDVNIVAFKPLQKRQIKRFLNGCFRVLTVSADLGAKLATIGIEKPRLEVVYNGVDGEVFRPIPKNQVRTKLGLPVDATIITFVGSLFKEKGCVELVKAFAALSPAKNNLLLVFVGQGGMLSQLKSDAERLGIAEQVRFIGRILHAELGPWFAAADITTLPSYNEGVPNVIMESMSCGVPVVASNVGGIPEVLADFAGIMVPSQNVAALTAGLSEALNRKWDANEIRRHAGTYTWKNTVDQIETIMKDAIRS
jgi:glycosyltransferase involved in cell wall biosynthesis